MVIHLVSHLYLYCSEPLDANRTWLSLFLLFLIFSEQQYILGKSKYGCAHSKYGCYPCALPSTTCLALFYSKMCHDREFLFQQMSRSTLGLRCDLGASEPLLCLYPSQPWSKQGSGRDGWEEKSCCAASRGPVVWVWVSRMLRVVCVP